MDEAVSLLVHERATLGVQVSIWTPTTGQHDLCWGTDHRLAPMTPEMLHSTFCVTKPILAVGVLAALDQVGLGADTVLANVLPPKPVSLSAVTVRDLLNHNAGLRDPTGPQYRLTPTRLRSALLAKSSDVRLEPTYSEISSWMLLEEIITYLTGKTAAEWIDDHVLRPLGLSTDITWSPQARQDPVGVSVGGLPDSFLPMLSELLQSELDELRPAMGAATNARGLCGWYRYLLLTISGPSRQVTLPSYVVADALARPRARTWDPALARECAFAGGFMVNLEDYGFPATLSKRSFGHVSGIVTSFALADPEFDLAIGFVCNTATYSTRAAERFRTEVVTAVLEDLGAV